MNSKRNWIYVLILALIGIITHTNWLNPTSVINFSDWLYFPDKTVSELWFTWGAWNPFWNMGFPNLQVSFYPFKFIWSIIGLLGFSYDTATKLTFFIPIALIGFISPYLLAKKLFKNNYISFVLALYYGSTTYFIIKQIAHIPIAFVYAFTPLIMYFFLVSLEKKRTLYWLILTLFLSLITWYEVRITFIVIGILFLYFILFYSTEYKKYIKQIVISILIFSGLNLFWTLPTMFTSVSGSISSLTERGMFGDFLFDMEHAFTVTEASWTGSLPNMEFIKQPVPWFMWLIPLLAFIPLFIIKKYSQQERKQIIFFLSLLIIGILLTKQSAAPFPWLYEFLFKKIPVFQLYREASKFYLITAVGLFGLLGFSMKYGEIALQSIKIPIKKANLLISVIILLLSFINLYPLVSNQFETTFVSHPVPKAFEKLNHEILSDSRFYRTLWLDTCCQYIVFNKYHPRAFEPEFVPMMNSILQIEDFGRELPEKSMLFFKDPRSQNTLQIASIKYIVVPVNSALSTEVQENIKLVNQLKQIQYLSISTLSNPSLVIFENKAYVPRFYLTENQIDINKLSSPTQISYKQILPSQYQISLKNISQKTYLQFSEGFHPDWKLRIGEFNVFAPLQQDDYFLNDSFHKPNMLHLNSYLIDPAYIKKHMNPNTYTLNKDGSISFTATLYFVPQTYFYIGLMASVLTFLICIIVLTLFVLRKNYEKN